MDATPPRRQPRWAYRGPAQHVLAAFAASPEASFITGTTIDATGGGNL